MQAGSCADCLAGFAHLHGDGADADGFREGRVDREGAAVAGRGQTGAGQYPDGRGAARGGGGLQEDR